MLIDYKKLPLWQSEILKDLKKYLVTTPETMLLMILNVKASQYLQIPRIRIQSPEDQRSALCNYYGLLFAPSGTGKDRTLKTIDELYFRESQLFFRTKVQEFIQQENERVDDEASDLKTNAARDNYRLVNAPRHLSLSFADGTPEGFLADREAYEKANWGGTTFINSELVNYLKQKDRIKGFLLSLIAEAFDNGDNDAKSIKGNKLCVVVKGVPSTLLATSSPADMHKDGIFNVILESLNRQLARRSFICFPDDCEFKDAPTELKSIIEHFEGTKNTFISTKYSKLFKDIIEHLDNHLTDVVYTLQNDAKEVYFKYYINCQLEGKKLYKSKNEGLRAEVLGRPWKMLKLAGILHSFTYNQFTEKITKETLLQAIYQTELFGKYFQKFYKHENPDELDELVGILLENPGKELLKTDIRAYRVVSKDKFAQWFDNNFDDICDLLEQKGYKFEQVKTKGNIKKYVVKEIA